MGFVVPAPAVAASAAAAYDNKIIATITIHNKTMYTNAISLFTLTVLMILQIVRIL